MQDLIVFSLVLLVISTLGIVINFIKLKTSLQFYRALKNKACICCSATVVEAHGTSNRSYESTKVVKAKYNLYGKQLFGKMICACDSRIMVGQKINIIVPKCNLEIFAFSEKQVVESMITYSTFAIISTIVTIALMVILGRLFLNV